MRFGQSRVGSGGVFVLGVVLCGAPSPLRGATGETGAAVKVDQAGYLPAARKVAVVVTANPATTFSVKSQIDGAVAFQGTLGPHTDDVDSGDSVQAADFTALQKEGRYFVEVPGVGRSFEFAIGRDVYDRPLYLAMRSYYGQRCGMAVDLGPQFPGYAHDACHRPAAWHASSGRSDGPAPSGGWHDAGDYGRYVVNSGITTGTLLWAYDLHHARLEGLRLDIPESNNGVPDVLDEIRYNLEWMLAMQDTDGGVFPKETSEGFCGFVMPEKDPLTSFVIGTGSAPFKSSCATADFTAVMAIAARIYKPVDGAFADRCLRAARAGWAWLAKYPDLAFHNPKGVVTGEYGDESCGDERLWAAVELWRAGGDEDAHRAFVEGAPRYRATLRAVGPPAWPEVAPLALWSYALAGGKDKALVESIREDTRKAASEIVSRSASNGYRISMTPTDYVWGSNGGVANYGLLLLVANVLSPDPRFVDAALDNLHYLLGRNAFSLSFVTGVGANPYKNPHHRPSAADRNPLPWPGLLSGGPNRLRQDPVMQKLPTLPPARMYADDEGSYASNETAINWNAPLVFLLTGASAAGRR